MPPRLLACSSCGRHVFANEPKCPFCEASPRFRASAITLGASLSLLACHGDAKPEIAPMVSASASASSAPVASADPASDDAGNGVIGRGKGPDRVSTIYGPAQSMDSPRGEITMAPSSATVPVGNADRVLAGLRPRLRAIYSAGLRSDPNSAAKLTYTLTVDATGEVTDVKLTGSGLSDVVMSNLQKILFKAQFDAPGTPSKISGTFTCTPPAQ